MTLGGEHRVAAVEPQPTEPSRPPVSHLAPEWRRMELLATCLLAGRRGEDPAADDLDALAEAAERVRTLRATGAWSPLAPSELADRELDVLAAVLVPSISARVAALYGASAPGLPAGAVTPALIQELLALEYHELPDLAAALRPTAPLRRAGLLAAGRFDSDWHEPVRPGPGLVERLLGVPEAVPTPPGALRVAVDAGLGLDALVLPADTRARLQEFVVAVRNRHRVVEWGGRWSGGPVALFSGPSGVGKSLAARAVAGELAWPLFRVDLGSLVSKYIGETEKNLTQLFDAAHGQELVLHFEEAESIFGRRGEIREARDRYANLEVSHLLARIEGHDGPCVLSTNLRRNLDTAFMRRFHTVVEFARPDRTARAELWRRLLPPRAPLAGDVDPDVLASVEMTGGEIHNAVLHACTQAGNGKGAVVVTNDVLALAIWRELGKDGRPLHTRDLGDLASALPRALRDEHGGSGR